MCGKWILIKIDKDACFKVAYYNLFLKKSETSLNLKTCFLLSEDDINTGVLNNDKI